LAVGEREGKVATKEERIEAIFGAVPGCAAEEVKGVLAKVLRMASGQECTTKALDVVAADEVRLTATFVGMYLEGRRTKPIAYKRLRGVLVRLEALDPGAGEAVRRAPWRAVQRAEGQAEDVPATPYDEGDAVDKVTHDENLLTEALAVAYEAGWEARQNREAT
jgi:hypothetical protein